MSQSVKMRSRIAKIELQILKKTCQQIDTPRSLTVFLLAHYGEIRQLLDLDINPDHYDTPSAFADDYLVTEMIKKSQALDTGINCEEVAYQKWISAEKQCADANEVLESYMCGSVIPTRLHVNRVIARAIQICHKTLGPLTRRTLQLVYDEMEFGPGATASVKGIVTRGRKFTNPVPKTSQRLLAFGLFCTPHLWREKIQGFSVQDHNELVFVPKNAKTHRAITIETDLNIYVQKGIGRVLKMKLNNLGIDTETQWRVNRHLVSRAYSDALCTIDLSSASDTVSFNLVRLFLPDDWFDLLCWARPEFTSYKGNLHSLEKFSGMGCGFTFELETLIFHSILVACKELSHSASPISTFGDDMICGLDIMEDVVDTLSFLGLKVNSDKSYGKSAFHESCGADFFKDQNVRPVYLRYGNFDHEKEFCIYLYCNLLRRYASHRNGGYTCDGRFLPAWLSCFTRLRTDRRTFVPSWDYESHGIVGNLDEAQPAARRACEHGFSGWIFSGLIRDTVETRRYRDGAYIASLSRMTAFTSGSEALRGKTRHATYKDFYSLSWIDLGPWV